MFSVIIPLYNKSDYIEKAVISVINQTFKRFEIIIINDGSTDNGAEKLEKLNKEITDSLNNVELKIVTQSNQGVSTARNNGVRIAKYDFIAFLDADDWWEKNYLAEMKSLIEEFPDAGIYGSNYFIVRNNKRTLPEFLEDKAFKQGLINYIQVYSKTVYIPLWTGATILKKQIFMSENGFKPSLTLGEDFDLWIRVALKYPVAFLNKPISNYNQDVEESSRGVIKSKIYTPTQHYIFNLDYLSKEESENPDLKKLLDNLRVYTLLRYRLNKVFERETKKELAKVDFKEQPLSVRLNYILPVMLLKAINNFRLYISNKIKKML